MEDYLGTVLSVDESIGQIMDYLKQNGLDRNTLVLYCGDQGFYMGEHGLYDKRWIFEESFRMPLIMRWPGHIRPGVRSSAMVQELDYAPTFCDVAGVNTKENMNTFEGRSLTPLFKTGEHQDFKNRSLYYAFYENPGEHNAPRHDGLRTDRYTLSYIWTSDEWMLFDNQKDPAQMHNVINKPEYAETVKKLKTPVRQAPQNCRYGRLPRGHRQTGRQAAVGLRSLQRLTPPFTVPPETGCPEHAIDDGGTGFKSSHKQQPLPYAPHEINFASRSVPGLPLLGRNQSLQHYSGARQRDDNFRNYQKPQNRP